MKKMSLKNKLAAGALALVLFVMFSTTLVVSFMVARQNEAASFATVARSLAIVDNDLAEQEAGLLEQIGQTVAAGELGEYLKYIAKNQSIGDGGNDLLRHEYERIVGNLENLAVLGKLWRIAAYGGDGGLIAFIAEKDGGGRLAGYYTGAEYRVDGGESQDEWKKTRDDPGLSMDARFTGTMPDAPVIEYRTIAGELCVAALIPTTASEYDVKTGTLRQERSGVVVAVRRLNGAFAEKIARLTGTEVSVFAGEKRTVGTMDEYRTLRSEDASRETIDAGSRNREILLNEISLEEGRYFQGVLPLTNDGTTAGSISVLYSRAAAAANTAQIVKIIAVTAIILLILILPVTLILANSLARPVRRVIDTLDSTAHEVNDGSVHVSTSSHQLAEGASEQASSIEETSSSLEELSSMTKQNADNARQADALMSEAAAVVSEVGGKLEKMTGAIREIGVNSDETHKIIKTIDEIAFQTNLLALNAAVEAARAGEAGAGFAVVAEEVRNLAIRSAEAAKNTSELIDTTVKSVREGERLNGETNEAFERNADISAKIRDLIGEIAAASQEQAQGIEQINRAMAEMDRVTQQTAANAEESASASEEMSAQAAGLQSIVGDLVLLVEGANGVSSKNGKTRARHSDAARKQGHSDDDETPLLEASSRGGMTRKEL